ncbi:CHRD domain-containing protein [Pelagophyceae sp. CCMP2097]|nr:CHRD domain-containing protein [Pelagophyceae sp. CCMP2097]
MPANTMLLLDGSQIPDDAGSKTAVGAVRLAFYDTQVCYYLATNETLTKLHIHADGGSVGVVFEVGSTFGCTQTTADAVDDILKNPSFYYLNAHTDAFPGGAMRADLYAPASMTLLLRGSEVPDGAGSTTGSGSIALSYYNTKVCFMLEVSDDVTPKSMNIHSGLVGESGGPVVTFSQVASGSLSGCVDNSDGTIETILYSPSSFYVNLHSVEFPGGAIRGQAAAPAAMSTLLEGSQVAPQEGNLAGSGDVELSFYKTKVCFQLTVSADVAAPTSMHIHSGLAGAGGDVVVALSTGALQGCVVTPLPAVLTHVLQYADHFYLNVHTGDFASGAIRGQLAAPAEMKFTLDAKQVPDHDKHDEGAGVIYVALYNTKVCFTLVSTASVMGIASMHIHAGAEGKTGGVVVDFADRTQFAFDDGETNAGCADNFDGAIGQILQDPYAYYFNVHTEEKPGGSIRGQLKPPATMLVKVDGAQVVGDGTTTGFGLVQLHYYQQKVCFSLHSQGVSATSMHIHSGVSGASGGVALAFGDFITEASTDGGFDVDRGCADYTAALIEVVLSAPAAFYFQAHSAAFPGGAVRGQLESNAEMSIPLEGSQVAPGSGSTTASGNIELFFYNQKVCFMLEVAGLTPTAMHVHSGVAGAGGGVVVDFPHVAEGLLEGCVVTTPTAALLDPAAFYVNVHSAEFPNGALRGQLFFEACTSEGQYPYYCTEAEAAANSPKGTGHGHDRLFMPDGGADNVHDGSYGGDAPQCKCDQRPKPPHDDDHDHSATTPKPTPAPTDGTATAAPTPAAGSSSGAASLRTSATAVIASALLVALFGTQ